MASFLAMFSTSALAWVILAFLNAKFKLLDKVGLGKTLSAKYQFWGLILVGLFITGALGSMLSNIGLSTAVETTTVGDIALTGEVDVTMISASAQTYGNDTSNEYLNDDKDVMTWYLKDGELADTQWGFFNATVERDQIGEDAVITVTCNAEDKEIAGESDKSLVTKTSGQVQLQINDGGTYVDDNTVEKKIAYSEGTASSVVKVAFKQDESYQDAMTDMDDYYDISCNADGVDFKLKVVAQTG